MNGLLGFQENPYLDFTYLYPMLKVRAKFSLIGVWIPIAGLIKNPPEALTGTLAAKGTGSGNPM